MDKLTIITITKDNFVHLQATVLSAKSLRHDGVNQLVVDTSRPDLADKIKTFCRRQKNVVYYHGYWSGIARSYNFGLGQVNRGWIWLLNASDDVHPDFNKNTFFNFLDQTSVEMVIFQIQGRQSKNKWPSIKDHRALPTFWVPQPGVIFRKDLANKVGKFNETYQIALDLDFWFRVFRLKTPLEIIPYPIALCDETGISNRLPKLAAKESLTVLTKEPFRSPGLILGSLRQYIRSLYLYLKILKTNEQ